MPTFGGIVVPTSSEADGRRTLLDIINELALPVDSDDDTVKALAADAFRAAVRTMNRKGSWPWELQDEDLAISDGNAYSTTVALVKQPLAMHRLSQAGATGVPQERMAYEPYFRFIEKYNQNISGQVRVYTIPNLFETGQVRWFPIPAGNDSARFTFYRITAAPRTETEAVEIPDYAIEVYLAYAWYEFLKRLPSQQRPYDIAIAGADAKQAFREMSAHVNAAGDRSRGFWPQESVVG